MMTKAKELWRPVVGYEGRYEVSNKGEVRSVARWVACRGGRRISEGVILSKRVSVGHYWSVSLYRGSVMEKCLVHRLVAAAFIPGNGAVVRHLDGDGFNNAVDNLAWGSHADNEADKLRHGRRPMGEAHPNSKMTDGHVRAIREMHERGLSQLAIAKSLGLNRGVVGIVVRGEGWTHVN